MARINKLLKFLLKLIFYIALIFFTSAIIVALYEIYNESKDNFNRGMAIFFLIVSCTFILLIICNLLKKIFIFILNKLKIPKKIFKNENSLFIAKLENILKITLKILFRLMLYAFILFLSALIIITLVDYSNNSDKTFPLEAAQYLIIIALLSIVMIAFRDLKRTYKFFAIKIKFLENFSERMKLISKELYIKINNKIKYVFEIFITKLSSLKRKIIEKTVNKKIFKAVVDKIIYFENIIHKSRYSFSNINENVKKFVEILYLFLAFLTILSFFSIFIPLTLIIIYKLIMFLFSLVFIIWGIIIASIIEFPLLALLFFSL